MKHINDFINTHYQKIVLIFLFAIFFNTCGNPTKITNKRIDSLRSTVDSVSSLITNIQKTSVSHQDLKIEGLRSEKRMIQSIDRKLIDVKRQSDIDVEIKQLESK